ncbi:hypothetical protein HDV00_003611 [Rhizophlyctis rosea]|nr:hypothetical protein HDV00_003611 [Rhizophlyctis rosea]
MYNSVVPVPSAAFTFSGEPIEVGRFYVFSPTSASMNRSTDTENDWVSLEGGGRMVLVLYKSATDQMVTIAKVTSFGGRTVQEKYPNSLWRRLTYIPVGDSPEELPASGTFLNPTYAKLETSNNTAFSRNCYVSVACLPVVSSRNLLNLSAGRVTINSQQLANLRVLHAHIIQETFPQPFLFPMLSPAAWNGGSYSGSYPESNFTGGFGSTPSPGATNRGGWGNANAQAQQGHGYGAGTYPPAADRTEDFDGVDDIIENGLGAFSSSNPYPNLRRAESVADAEAMNDNGLALPAQILVRATTRTLKPKPNPHLAMNGEEYSYESALPKRILNLKNWEKLVKEVIMVEPDETQPDLDGKKRYWVLHFGTTGIT